MTPADLRAAVALWCAAKRFISDPAEVCDGAEFRAVSDLLASGVSVEVFYCAADLICEARLEVVVPLRAALGDGPELREWELGRPELIARAYRTWIRVYLDRGAR